MSLRVWDSTAIVRRLSLAALFGCCGFAACTQAPKYRRAVEPKPQATAPAPASNEIVRIARDYIGTPYRRGGTTDNGMDCSGLVVRVFQTAGIAVPRRSSDQARFGAAVDRAKLRPGDLVFFETSGRGVSHVGIYTGRGRFIHASTRARRVRSDRLDDKYFRRRFVTARRFL